MNRSATRPNPSRPTMLGLVSVAQRVTPEHQAFRLAMTLHHPPEHPHWSERIEWRPDRWDPMCNAPTEGYPILWVRGRTADGRIIERMHRACGDGDGLMPPFDGWFKSDGVDPHSGRSLGFSQVRPVEWQPLRAAPEPRT